MEQKKLVFFRQQLMKWFAKNHRPLPWKGEKDPYLIWLSEIILQQTRVEQGLPYFERFKIKFPTVHDLASASEDEVFKLWEGLGYYSRARNLHYTAKYVVKEYNGVFPDTYKDILGLKGVGPYTAAAIASFAYGLPHAVVDGNVYRVFSRYLGIETPIDSTSGKKEFAQIAQAALDVSQPGTYNQAIMDFGATHCTPKNPSCSDCLLKERCQGLALGKIHQLPVKQKSIARKARFFHYLLINFDGQVPIRKRTKKDIWRNLYEFPLIELEATVTSPQQLQKEEKWIHIFQQKPVRITQISPPSRQLLTHQIIHSTFWEVQVKDELTLAEEGYLWVERERLNEFAFPKTIDLYLRDKTLYLKLL